MDFRDDGLRMRWGPRMPTLAKSRAKESSSFLAASGGGLGLRGSSFVDGGSRGKVPSFAAACDGGAVGPQLQGAVDGLAEQMRQTREQLNDVLRQAHAAKLGQRQLAAAVTQMEARLTASIVAAMREMALTSRAPAATHFDCTETSAEEAAVVDDDQCDPSGLEDLLEPSRSIGLDFLSDRPALADSPSAPLRAELQRCREVALLAVGALLFALGLLVGCLGPSTLRGAIPTSAETSAPDIWLESAAQEWFSSRRDPMEQWLSLVLLTFFVLSITLALRRGRPLVSRNAGMKKPDGARNSMFKGWHSMKEKSRTRREHSRDCSSKVSSNSGRLQEDSESGSGMRQRRTLSKTQRATQHATRHLCVHEMEGSAVDERMPDKDEKVNTQGNIADSCHMQTNEAICPSGDDSNAVAARDPQGVPEHVLDLDGDGQVPVVGCSEMHTVMSSRDDGECLAEDLEDQAENVCVGDTPTAMVASDGAGDRPRDTGHDSASKRVVAAVLRSEDGDETLRQRHLKTSKLDALTAKDISPLGSANRDVVTRVQQIAGHCRSGSVMVDEFLKSIEYPEVGSVNESNLTALHQAVLLGDRQSLAALLDDERFTSADAPGGSYGRTALHLAAERGDTLSVDLLLDHPRFGGVAGAADTRDSGGHTALHRASAGGHSSTASALLGHARFSASDVADNDGRTALHRAAHFGHLAAARALLVHPRFKASLLQDLRGETALDVAAVRGHQDVLEAIRDGIGGG